MGIVSREKERGGKKVRMKEESVKRRKDTGGKKVESKVCKGQRRKQREECEEEEGERRV